MKNASPSNFPDCQSRSTHKETIATHRPFTIKRQVQANIPQIQTVTCDPRLKDRTQISNCPSNRFNSRRRESQIPNRADSPPPTNQMAESSTADTTVSGLKVTLNCSSQSEHRVRINVKTSELTLRSTINFRFQTFCCRILLSQILSVLAPAPSRALPI